MTRYPGVTTWAYIIPGRGQPRLASGQSTDSAAWTVIALGEIIPNRWARSALASSVAGPSADSSPGVLVGIGMGVAVGERGMGLGDGVAVGVGVRVGATADGGVGGAAGAMLGAGVGDAVGVGGRVAVDAGLGDGTGTNVDVGDGVATGTASGIVAGDRTAAVGVWVRVATRAGPAVGEAGDSAASGRVSAAGSPQPPAADATKMRASDTAQCGRGMSQFR